ncbi:hypothetical protein Bsp3421_002615 [Burkholderia sp. FERM BP-3421]|jgi:hypothetical protein|uniref:hypothetical protein n=1 Tax=Burkholderia sp. FERM BP-3421 TaxID=1494466 RepID=UPI00235E8855|nr:hypothetical protein [Burkholderia sp. FERM BP-3421]WDD92597.1 hypothetical protein Bsp3421_002615 [Burkholderia sp. FERM BP-3421]
MNKTTSAHKRDHERVPESSTLMGLLYVLRKAHVDLVGKDAAHQRFARVSTRGDAREYIKELMPRLLKEREIRRQREHGPNK